MNASINIPIETATAQDISAVLAIDRTVSNDPERREALAAAIQGGECMIARLGGDPAGYAVLDRSFYGHGFIPLLVVRPEHRRHGVATALIRHIECICPPEKVFTSTNASNVAMRRVLERAGFVRSGWIDNLDEGDPEIVYFKRLPKVDHRWPAASVEVGPWR